MGCCGNGVHSSSGCDWHSQALGRQLPNGIWQSLSCRSSPSAALRPAQSADLAFGPRIGVVKGRCLGKACVVLGWAVNPIKPLEGGWSLGLLGRLCCCDKCSRGGESAIMNHNGESGVCDVYLERGQGIPREKGRKWASNEEQWNLLAITLNPSLVKLGGDPRSFIKPENSEDVVGMAMFSMFSPGLLWGSSLGWVEARLLSSICAGQLTPKCSAMGSGR